MLFSEFSQHADELDAIKPTGHGNLENTTGSVWLKAIDQVTETSNVLVPMQTAGKKRPVFALPGIGGSVLCLQPLSQALGSNQPFYGIQSVGFDGKTPPLESVEKMAAVNLEAIKSIQKNGPYNILGYSYGGIIAFEMAKTLLEQNEKVSSIIFLDSLCPSLQVNDDVEQIMHLFNNFSQVTGIRIDIDAETLKKTKGDDRIEYLYNLMKPFGFNMTKEQFITLYSVSMTNERSCRAY
ncbi:MAG: alpha/beta fold hydrolase, partial [Bacteroidales bacterium]|nr:alpha/beta fold hydrolase [Bacteroidales bacterium]